MEASRAEQRAREGDRAKREEAERRLEVAGREAEERRRRASRAEAEQGLKALLQVGLWREGGQGRYAENISLGKKERLYSWCILQPRLANKLVSR